MLYQLEKYKRDKRGSFAVSSDLYYAAKEVAKKQGVTLNELINKLLYECVESQQKSLL